jgi:hypothetical protein
MPGSRNGPDARRQARGGQAGPDAAEQQRQLDRGPRDLEGGGDLQEGHGLPVRPLAGGVQQAAGFWRMSGRLIGVQVGCSGSCDRQSRASRWRSSCVRAAGSARALGVV